MRNTRFKKLTTWHLWTVETMYFDVWNPFFISTASSPARFATPEASLCQDLLPRRWSTVTKSSLGLISWATVLISSHPVICKIQMWPVNTPSKHETLTQCWSKYGPILWRWPSIKTTLVERLVFAGLRVWQCKPTPTQSLLNVGPASPVLASIHLTVVSRPS